MTTASNAGRAQERETATEAEERKAPSPAWSILYQHQSNESARNGPVLKSRRTQPRARPRALGRRWIWPLGAAAALTVGLLAVMLVLAQSPGGHGTRVISEPLRSQAASSGRAPSAPRPAQEPVPPPNARPADAAAPALVAKPNTAPSARSAIPSTSADAAHMAPPDHAASSSSPPPVAEANSLARMPASPLPAQAAGVARDADTAPGSRKDVATGSTIGSPTPSLLVVATGNDTLATLYRKVYQGLTPPPFTAITALNPPQPRPGDLLTFPPPVDGWYASGLPHTKR